MPQEPVSMLVVEAGIPGLRAIPIDQPVYLIGSAPTADLFVDNPYIFRMHAQIVQEGDKFRIRDLDTAKTGRL